MYDLDSIKVEIAEKLNVPAVYKVEVDGIRDRVSRLYDKDHRKFSSKIDIPYAKMSRDQYDALDKSRSVNQVVSKVLTKILSNLPQGDVIKRGIGELVEDYAPLLADLKTLKERQTLGRQPKADRPVIAQREQLRAICPCCFREQAIKDGTMVAHGYTIEYGFFNGTCLGHQQPHFGTEAGREFTRVILAEIETRLAGSQARLKDIEAKAPGIKIFTRRGILIEKPVDIDFRAEAERQKVYIHALKDNRKFMKRHIDGWKLTDPVVKLIDIYQEME